MTKVDFYILDSASNQKALHFACQLIEKAYTEQKRIFIHTHSNEEAERFDALLWTYRDDSFLPHALIHLEGKFPPPIQIGFGEIPKGHEDLLVNLSPSIPIFYTQFRQVVEIVYADVAAQQSARERYKEYRDKGCDLNTIKLKANEL